LAELEGMHDFDVDEWKQRLEIPSELAAINKDVPVGALENVCALIKTREESIKSQLVAGIDLVTSTGNVAHPNGPGLPVDDTSSTPT
jgi:hypothetical protein